jgi:hypothetical protein
MRRSALACRVKYREEQVLTDAVFTPVAPPQVTLPAARHGACTWLGMRLRHVAGCGVLAVALGVACGGRTTDVGSPAERALEEGGAPESSASAPADAGSSDAGSGWSDSMAPQAIPPDAADQPGPTQVANCCCGNSYDSRWCNAACPCGTLFDADAAQGTVQYGDASSQGQLGGGVDVPCLTCGVLDAGGQSDAAQVDACDAGCPCFGSNEALCTAFRCVWDGESCIDGPGPGGSTVGEVSPPSE